MRGIYVRTRETREKLSESKRKLKREQLEALVQDYLANELSAAELCAKYDLCGLSPQLHYAIELGLLTEEQKAASLAYRRFHISDITRQKISNAGKGRKHAPETLEKIASSSKGRTFTPEVREKLFDAHAQFRKLSDDALASLAYDYVFFDDSPYELTQQYGVRVIHRQLKLAVRLGYISEEQRTGAVARRTNSETKSGWYTAEKRQLQSQRAKGRPCSDETKRKKSEAFKGRSYTEETLERMSLSAINRSKYEPKRFHVEGRFYSASYSEGAAALLLEKYVPDFKIVTGKTFQENGDTHCIYDFILENAILEWHPICLSHDGKLLPDQYNAWRELKAGVIKGQRSELHAIKSVFEDELAVEYWFRRQLSSDESKVFKGKEVCLARTVDDLYDFLGRFNGIPDNAAFAQEFRFLCKYVGRFDTQKKSN